MARRRQIDPRIWQSEQFNKLDYRQRVLYIGLVSNADDYGKMKGHPAWIRSQVFPYDDITVPEIEADLDYLASLRGSDGTPLIYRYQHGGEWFMQHPHWFRYQYIDKPQESFLPDHPDYCEETPLPYQQRKYGKQAKKHGANDSENDSKNDSKIDSETKEVKGKEVNTYSADEKTSAAGGADAIPQEGTPAKQKRQPTPEDDACRLLVEHFAGVVHIPQPEPKSRDGPSLWYAPLRKIARLVELDIGAGKELITAAVQELDGKGLTIANPNSILKTVISLHGKRQRGVNTNGAQAKPRTFQDADGNWHVPNR